MTNIQFTLPDKYQNRERLILKMINENNGSWKKTTTKDGIFFSIAFSNKDDVNSFNDFLNKLIPDIYEY